MKSPFKGRLSWVIGFLKSPVRGMNRISFRTADVPLDLVSPRRWLMKLPRRFVDWQFSCAASWGQSRRNL